MRILIGWGVPDFDGYASKHGAYVGTFLLHCGRNSTSGRGGSFTSSELSNMINCNYFNIEVAILNSLDGNDFVNMTRDFSLILYTSIFDVSKVSNINASSHLVSLLLNDCSVVDVSCFSVDKEKSKIKSLYLNNCQIGNYSGSNVLSSKILGELPCLTYVDLRNNPDMTDFSGLTNNGFVETSSGSRIFTRNL